MGQGDRATVTSTIPDRFRTPNKPASASKLKRAPARLGSVTNTPGTGSTSAPSADSTPSFLKRNSSSDQATLTQIDFVTVSQQNESDDDFDYVDDSKKNAREVIEIEDDDDDEQGNNRDVDYRPPSTSRAKKGRRAKSDPAPPRQKNSSIQGDGLSGQGRRKSANKKDKGPPKDDKTLTQMNYVQRVLVEPDEDVKLEYAYITPKKRIPKRQTVNTDKANETYISEPSSDQKRRKLSASSEGKGLEMEGNFQKKVKGSPVTPRKSTRTEIPSSQSPESPGIAFITSSQFRSATRSPKTRALKSPNEPFIKEEFRGPIDRRVSSKSPQVACADKKPSLNHLNSPRLSPSPRLDMAKDTTKFKKPPSLPSDFTTNTSDSRQHPGPLQRTVVYETDAESDDGDSGDELLDFPSSPRNGNALNANYDYETQSEDGSNPPNTESQELPPPPVPDQGTNLGPYPFESNPLSDASICYQRLHPATQFPLEPVPTINTQKMAELFPNDSNGLHTLTPSPSSSPTKTRPELKLQMVSQTQYTDSDQAESQAPNEIPTEIIPASSPVARDEDSTSLNRRDPGGRDAVVQVESSQAVDRAHNQRTAGQVSAPRGMLTRSQILTSSVMESVPVPFWMSSQDSVGEPYSLPDT